MVEFSRRAPPATMTSLRELPGGGLVEYRPDSVDALVLDPEYQRARFFAHDYVPSDCEVIVDAGAHIGVFTVLVACLAPSARLHAIEAEAENCALLRRNVARNGLSNVEVHQLALCGHSGPVELRRDTENWGHMIAGPTGLSVSDRGPAEGRPERNVVAGQTLRAFLADHRIDEIDYLKMNIEGAEYEVLEDASDGDLAAIRRLLVEFHPMPGRKGGDLARRLHSAGFDVDLEHDVAPGKGWITGRRRHAGWSRGTG